jgi:hypothetical protein
MPIYCIDIEAAPTSATPKAADIQSASAIIFVNASSENKALAKARSHLIDYAWNETKVAKLFVCKPERIPHLEKDIAALYFQALQQGLASVFYVFPKVPQAKYTAPEFRSLGTPVIRKQ